MVHLIKLTVPSEAGIDSTFKRKKAKCTELAAESWEVDWKPTIYSVEVGSCGYVGISAVCLLREAGVTEGKL